jgi:hypothetical protein
MSWLSKWSNEEIAYVVSASARSVSWDKMARNFNRKFDTTVSGNTLKKLYRVLTENNTYTQEEVDFIHKCYHNLMTEKQTVMAYGEVFGKPLDRKGWKGLLVSTPSKEIQELVKSQKENKNKEVKNMKKIRKGHGGKAIPYTKKEVKIIKECKSRAEAIKLSSVLGRSESGISRKWWELNRNTSKVKSFKPKRKAKGRFVAYTNEEKRMILSCNSAVEAGKLSSILGRTNQAVIRQWYVLKQKHREEPKYLEVETVNRSIVVEPKKSKKVLWTDDEDFDILCNFYELSIDETREKFNKSYAEIAGRLEYIVDSTEPQHHSMLIEAAKVIKKRKEQRAKPSKPSRKERRIARKQARLQKRIDKIKKQLRRD